ncbi:uncharacterized protein BDV17DRAFT_218795 [Aspergillus undulatus]|uniref:uncharacterized protein n=1 Tax=Aspergillus undulatus TaxID=1810928 RepID=UPI003CCCCFC6
MEGTHRGKQVNPERTEVGGSEEMKSIERRRELWGVEASREARRRGTGIDKYRSMHAMKS